MKGLMVSILKDNSITDCTNGGVSSKLDRILLIGEGVPEVFEATKDRPILKLIKRNLYGREYIHAEPIERPTGMGWMMGGNFIWSSDSRFPNLYPIAIHDREESRKQYLSND